MCDRARGTGRTLRVWIDADLNGQKAAVVSVDHVVDQKHELAVFRRLEREGLPRIMLIEDRKDMEGLAASEPARAASAR